MFFLHYHQFLFFCSQNRNYVYNQHVRSLFFSHQEKSRDSLFFPHYLMFCLCASFILLFNIVYFACLTRPFSNQCPCLSFFLCFCFHCFLLQPRNGSEDVWTTFNAVQKIDLSSHHVIAHYLKHQNTFPFFFFCPVRDSTNTTHSDHLSNVQYEKIQKRVLFTNIITTRQVSINVNNQTIISVVCPVSILYLSLRSRCPFILDDSLFFNPRPLSIFCLLCFSFIQLTPFSYPYPHL